MNMTKNECHMKMGKNLFAPGGKMGTMDHVNTKNTDGQDISFYFVGTTMVVENNPCQ